MGVVQLCKSVTKSISRAVSGDPEVRGLVAHHPRFFGFVRRRLNPETGFGVQVTIGALLAVYWAALFVGIVEDLVGRQPLLQTDLRIINLVPLLRTAAGSHVMLVVSALGQWQVVVTGMMVVAIVLVGYRRWHDLAALGVSVAGGELLVWWAKHLIARPRPPLVAALVTESGFSFPSGHSFVAVSFYGLVTYFVVRAAPGWWRKVTTVIGGASLIGAVGFSRVYLGAHWPSDVLAGFTAGLAWLTTIITILEVWRKYHRDLPIVDPGRRRLWWWGLAAAGVWILHLAFYVNYHPLLPPSAVTPPVIRVNADAIPQRLFATLPRFSESIIGSLMEPINIIVVGSLPQLRETLTAAGWYRTDPITFGSLWSLLRTSLFNQPYPQAPGNPAFWDAQPNVFAYERPTAAGTVRERHHIHFWQTPFAVADGREVWLATAHFDTTINLRSSRLLPSHTIDPAVDVERDAFTQDMQRTGTVASVGSYPLVKPSLGKNLSGGQFFTDGKVSVIFLQP